MSQEVIQPVEGDWRYFPHKGKYVVQKYLSWFWDEMAIVDTPEEAHKFISDQQDYAAARDAVYIRADRRQ